MVAGFDRADAHILRSRVPGEPGTRREALEAASYFPDTALERVCDEDAVLRAPGGCSFLVLVLGFVGGVLIFSGISGLHLASSIPWVEIVTMAGKAYLASWMMMAIQTWFSMRFSGVAAAGIGFASLVAGFILLGIVARHGEMFSSLSSCYPWMLAFRTLSLGPRDLHSTSLPAVFGCVGGVLVGALACWDLARRREGE